MNRYLVFAWYCHYPYGGFRDLKDSFESLSEAKAHLKFLVSEMEEGEEWRGVYDGGEIFDCDTREIIFTA